MDNSKYINRTTKIIFENAACWITDMLYNHLYIDAKNRKHINNSDLADSLTDEYKRGVSTFLHAIKVDGKCYKRALDGLYKKHLDSDVCNRSLTFTGYLDMLAEQFTPAEFFSQLTSEQKNKMLMHILLNLLEQMFVFVSRPDILRLIIDNHADPINIGLLQDHAMSILITEKDRVYNLYVKANTSGEPHHDIRDKMKDVIRTLVREKGALLKELVELRDKLKKMTRKKPKATSDSSDGDSPSDSNSGDSSADDNDSETSNSVFESESEPVKKSRKHKANHKSRDKDKDKDKNKHKNKVNDSVKDKDKKNKILISRRRSISRKDNMKSDSSSDADHAKKAVIGRHRERFTNRRPSTFTRMTSANKDEGSRDDRGDKHKDKHSDDLPLLIDTIDKKSDSTHNKKEKTGEKDNDQNKDKHATVTIDDIGESLSDNEASGAETGLSE